ncbi:hypothetical protein OG747_10800 [Streptomyces sp. NBC_01384]|uniref:hypothetical protein n=1 Tax=Streptomyces sp. NBC_01384 TaxID=2903847 RepID=UPI00324C5CFB
MMMGYEEDGQKYVSLAGLRARGWTGGIVQRLLGAPDRLAVNPRFRSAPHTRLYRAERVEAAERSQGFRAVAETAGRRSEAVRAALERRRAEVMERVRNEPIEVPRLDPGKLALRAVEHRARHCPGSAEGPGERPETEAAAVEGASRASLDRWKVEYLRHRLGGYDQLLDRLPVGGRSSGRAEAAALLRRRVYAAIAEAYPTLARECERQARDQWHGPPP